MMNFNSPLTKSFFCLAWSMSFIPPQRETMSLETFSNAINDNKVINPNFSQEMPENLRKGFEYSLKRITSTKERDLKLNKMEILKKAYHLGLVGSNGNILDNNFNSIPIDKKQFDHYEELKHQAFEQLGVDYQRKTIDTEQNIIELLDKDKSNSSYNQNSSKINTIKNNFPLLNIKI